MLGVSKISAPNSCKRELKALAWARALVTRIFLPNNGRLSNQAKSLRNLTTLPTIKIAGGFKPALSTSALALATVVSNTRCSGLVPQRITAAGVCGSRPFSINFLVI